jgi:flagellar basal body rod protein FlgG
MEAGNLLGMQTNFRALDQWISNLNDQAKNTVRTGFKTSRSTFTGGQTTQEVYKSPMMRQFAEQIFGRTESIDWSQGDIVSSNSQWHAGIRGSGFFAVAPDLNQGTQVYYTRDGEFHTDDQGKVRTKEGYYVLMRSDVDQTNPANPHVVAAAAQGATDLAPFSIKLATRGGDNDNFTDGIDTNIWNIAGSPTVDTEGIHIDNYSGTPLEGINSVNSYTGSGTFDVEMRFDKFPTKFNSSSDYALGLQGGGATAPHILVTDNGGAATTTPDLDGLGNADGQYSFYGNTSSGIMPPGPFAINGTPYHGGNQTDYLWKPGSIVDGQFHKYRMEWTATTSNFYFDGALVSWSKLGASGVSTVAFQFANNPTNPTEITLKQFSFITNNPITLNGMIPGMKAEIRDRNGVIVGSGIANGAGVVTLPTTILSPMPYTGAQIWIYTAGGQVVGSQTVTDAAGMNGGDTYAISMFQFAKFDDLDALSYANPLIGENYLVAGTQMGCFLNSGVGGAGKLIRYALEAANVTTQGMTPELNLAKTMYGNLTKVLQARVMNIDSILSIVK